MMYKFASNNNINYILTGGNYSTECIRNPIEWMYYQSDSVQLKDIQNKFGTIPLISYPMTSILWHKFYLPYVKGIKTIRPLDYVPYNKEKASNLLVKKFGFQKYPQKHFESRFTRFYESYWLVQRFGFDTRKVQFSSLILSGQMGPFLAGRDLFLVAGCSQRSSRNQNCPSGPSRLAKIIVFCHIYERMKSMKRI